MITHLDELALDADTLTNKFGIDVSNLGWLWQIFAPEPATAEMKQFLHNFWTNVLKDANSTIQDYVGVGSEHKGNAENFLKGIYVTKMSKVYATLHLTFLRWVPEDVPFTLILLFDEARSLCEISSYDGKHIIDDNFYNNDGSRRSDICVNETSYPFTNFRALKRAFRFLLYCSRTVDKPLPRLFGLFTDTASRLADFQPHPSIDRSARIYSEYAPGNRQFQPFYTFTSIDAHARILCDGPCLSDAELVADPVRLIKFGRAGWYSMYRGRDNKNNQFYDIDKMTIVAGNKLLCMSGNSILDLHDQVQNAGPRLSSALSLKLFALLAVRLDIAAGPFTIEAGELVASHLAVLIDVNTDRSFLKTAYPSEPILAATAAEHIEVIGWDRPLMVLCKYIDSSVVAAGFRGELLTKVVCLIAMDEVICALQPRKSPTPSPSRGSQSLTQPRVPRSRVRTLSFTDPKSKSGSFSSAQPGPRPRSQPPQPLPASWRYAKPVKVYQYLDHLLTPPNEYQSFSSALIAQSASLRVDSEKLNQLLNGYVFFNHFNKSHVKISMELMAKAWNRGAALMCKPCTKSVDYFIPVVLAQPGTETQFGPMFDPWTRTQIDEASEYMSFILINSKNYHDDVDHETAALSIAPNNANFEDKFSFDSKKNVYLSILQEFGPSENNQGKVKERVKLLLPKRGPGEKQQIVVLLKGYDGETYKCLTDLPPRDPSYQKRRLMQEAVKHLKERVELGEMKGDEDDLRYVTIKEGFYTSGNTKENWRNDWKVMKESVEHRDVMMSDATVINQAKTGLHSLEEVLEDEEGDCMDIE